MKFNVKALFAMAALVCLIPAASFAAVGSYAQDFEGMNPADNAALANDGWLIFANVFAPDMSYLYGYGVFTAPNNSGNFCQVDINQGGAEQGMNQLAVFSDYANVDHAAGNIIEALVFQERPIEAGDEGTYVFTYQGKRGNLEGSSTALAYIKTLDPNAGYATTNYITLDMTTAPTDWASYELSIEVDSSLVGQLLQIGFQNMATNYEGSAVFYDNILFGLDSVATEPSTMGGIKSLYR
jgi:hypothetical protein|nr:hypothetical protein [Candidatus Krumholzibacteria bacterium]